ncbi:Ubiquitin-conjugating enzyme E2 [Spironucleus salmonicida]|uniref:Ubiquitin-conjugating enzyme E2 n=1 Tax=Spironucleus salmonicida TaxID=348837 RepID=V6LKK5_9EUKA|nr:Ubiquitin-conjugating enzyme E2 [Spironucleus salmonicida]|eukprot:EST44888.1 Ubiquitin-conjugating enzyme E2 [Spironucleus salmonicida]
MSNKTTDKRLMSDFRNLVQSAPEHFLASPRKEDLRSWAAVILGPPDTPWEGAALCLEINFPDGYPTQPPKIVFKTKMFHPNVYNDGRICLDILAERWSPAYDVSSVLVSIQSLLVDPNPASPANAEASSLYVRDRNAYDLRVQKVVEDSWENIESGPFVELLDKLIGEKENEEK